MLLQLGESYSYCRQLPLCPDPLAFFAHYTRDGIAPGHILLESAQQSGAPLDRRSRSLAVVHNAARLTCRARTVTIESYSPNGSALLDWAAAKAREVGIPLERHNARALQLHFPPVNPATHDDHRLKALSPTDALRWLTLGLSDQSRQPAISPIAVGIFSYDLLGSYEQLPAAPVDPFNFPDFEFWIPDQFVWLDHQHQHALVVAPVFGGGPAGCVGDATAAIATLSAQLEAAANTDPQNPSRPQPSSGACAPDMDDEAFAKLVVQLKQHIVAGDVFQIVPSRTFVAPCQQPLIAYQQLRQINPSPYMFYVASTQGTLIGASPETALSVQGTPPVVEIHPLAGTRARGKHPDGSIDRDLDSRFEAELRRDTKELAEHMMLVDLARNDVARVSVTGTRTVDRLLDVVRYSHVMHLASKVVGQLRPDLDALHAYVATMNMGTLVGAPKLRAAELLRQYEPKKRGPYGGAVGYLTADGRFDTGIVIRAAWIQQNMAHVRAGAGVVYDSDPMMEAEETRRKASAVLRAISN